MRPSADPQRLRIAFVYDALIPYCSGGAERRFHELARRLAKRHDVHYVTWRWWGSAPLHFENGITYHGVGAPRTFYGADGRRTVREQLAFAALLPATLARLDVDVIDISATPYLPVFAAWLTTRATRTPLVATWHEFWGDHWLDYLEDRPVVARLARLAEAVARPMADRRVAVSSFTARRMHEGRRAATAGDPAGSPIDVVANGVELAPFAAAASSRRSTDVLFVGRLIEEKGVDLLLRAIAALLPTHPKLKVAIVGDGPERAALERLATDLGLSGTVVFTGRVPDDELPRRMGDARLFVLPSSREGFGITVVEAQAAGAVPIVIRSALNAATDLIRNGEDGLVSDASVLQLARAIAGLLGDRPRLARLSAAARDTAAGRGWDDRAAEMEHVYANVVAARRRSGSLAAADPQREAVR